MSMFYAVLAYVMAVFNLSRGVDPVNVMNLVMGALWLIIGVVFTVKYFQDRKKAKKRKEMRQREE